jgi:hypothetical protein
MDLGQLTSPPHSTFAFANWVINDLRNSQRPLASVELLVSPANDYILPNGQTRPVESATMPNVKKAFDRWFARCNSSTENMGMVYFCGHGVLRENTALLLEDYGESPNRPFETAIDMEMTHKGMESCKASLRCCFIDSCRQEAYKLGRQLQDPATVLVQPEFGMASAADAPIFYASAPGTLAYGLTGKVSRFTEALLKCLKGLGAKKDETGTKWLVTTGSLANAVSQIVQEMNKNGGEGLQLSPTGGNNLGSSIVHEVQADPEVTVEVCCNPIAATDDGAFMLKATDRKYERPPGTGKWVLDVKADYYVASVNFPRKNWKDSKTVVWALPPGPHRPHLEVKP